MNTASNEIEIAMAWNEVFNSHRFQETLDSIIAVNDRKYGIVSGQQVRLDIEQEMQKRCHRMGLTASQELLLEG